MSPFSKVPERTVWNGMSQWRVSRAIYASVSILVPTLYKISTHLGPPFVSSRPDRLGMCLPVSFDIGADVGDLSAVDETGRNGESLYGVDRHLVLSSVVKKI